MVIFTYTRKDLEERDVLKDFLHFHGLDSPEKLQEIEDVDRHTDILADLIVENIKDDYDRAHRMARNMIYGIIMHTVVPHTLAYQD